MVSKAFPTQQETVSEFGVTLEPQCLKTIQQVTKSVSQKEE